MGASVKRCLASITWAAVGLLSQQIGVPRRKQREQQAQELGGGRDPLIVVREFVHGRGDMGERRHWTTSLQSLQHRGDFSEGIQG